LLSGLSAAFTRSGYDQKKLLGWICNSDVYQLHAVATDEDDPNFFRIKRSQPAGPVERCTADIEEIAQ